MGVIAALAVAAIAVLAPPIRYAGAPAFLYAIAAASVALLGVVMAVMAILTAFMSLEYRSVLEAMPGGLSRAMNPYRIVAFGSASAGALSLVAALCWPATSWWIKVAILGLASGWVVWLLVGSAQLLLVTFNHGQDSASLSSHMATVRAAYEQRLRETR